ncbi:DUF1320 domain-containing protein [bacterium 1XD42-54]|nr:DUF1320 domain-containing protein [bacterium 1XD42-54]
MAYSKAEDVLDMIKPDMLRSLIGDNCRLEGEELREAAMPYAQIAVDDADSEIDGYLAKRYRVPLSKVPKMITKLSKDIAVYNLASRRGIDESEREKNILNRYNAAILYLTNVAKGIVELDGQTSGGTGEALPDAQGNAGFSIQSNGRVFSRKSMRGW